MTVDDFVKLLDSVTRFVTVLSWPALLAFVLIRFGPALRNFFEGMGEFSFKGPDFEASAKRKKAEAAAALVAAEASRSDAGATSPSAAQEVRDTAALVAEAVTPSILRKAGKATILWVDDKPDYNVYDRQSLEAIGVSCICAAAGGLTHHEHQYA
jgi:hypothetical protein